MKASQIIKSYLILSSQVKKRRVRLEWGKGDGRGKRGKQEEKERWKRRSGRLQEAERVYRKEAQGEECTQLGGSCREFPHVPPSLCQHLPLFFLTGSVSQVLSWVFLLLPKSRDKETSGLYLGHGSHDDKSLNGLLLQQAFS